jgi:transcriptional regulator with XRE-family HTH domain
MTVDRRTLNVLLAALDIEQRELAGRMGYDQAYVANILNGFALPSDSFKQAFGEALTDLLIGASHTDVTQLPAQPLIDFLNRRACQAESRACFFEELGLNPQSWTRRKYVNESQLDRICCALGVHPSAIYGSDYEIAS